MDEILDVYIIKEDADAVELSAARGQKQVATMELNRERHLAAVTIEPDAHAADKKMVLMLALAYAGKHASIRPDEQVTWLSLLFFSSIPPDTHAFSTGNLSATLKNAGVKVDEPFAA